MRSRTLMRFTPAFAGLLAAALFAGCGKPPTAPTPVLATETVTGTVDVLGSSTKTFTVDYDNDISDASLTVASLTRVSDGTPVTVTIGIGFGEIAFDGSCVLATRYTSNAAAIGQELIAAGAFFGGDYCFRIFDSGTLTEPVTYTVTLKHY